jgi:hypothetical protein
VREDPASPKLNERLTVSEFRPVVTGESSRAGPTQTCPKLPAKFNVIIDNEGAQSVGGGHLLSRGPHRDEKGKGENVDEVTCFIGAPSRTDFRK